MPTAQLNGIDLYYEDNGSGFPVLMSHGYGSTSAMWQGQIAPLTERYRLITWDMRGHGATDSPEDAAAYSEALTVDDIAALLRHLGIEQAVIGGLSLGGYMSLAFNLAYPEMVKALILCDTGPGYRNPKSREGWNETSFKRAERFESEGLDALGRSPEVEAVRSRHRSAAGLAKAARGMLAQFDARVIESLDSISVPTLIIVGANDTPFLNGTDYMASKIPGSRKVVIADAGHASNIDQPQAFNSAVLEFLDEVT
jgi:pimeloyl-ACP methyl ester carboxylesterase